MKLAGWPTSPIERPLHVAVIAPLRYPIAEPFAGGLEAHTHHLVAGLQAEGHRVSLFAHPDSDARFDLQAQSTQIPTVAGMILPYARLVRELRRATFEVVHNNSIHFAPPLLARFLAIPQVTVLHTPPFRSHRWTGRFSNSPRHHYVAISNYIARQWSDVVGPSEVVYNGIDLDVFSFSAHPKSATAVWVGRIHPEKAPDHALRAALAAGWQIDLIGTIEDREYYKATIEPLLSDRARYLGHLSQPRIAGVIGRAQAGLVTPVWEEPFGLVCAEIMACGTPVLAYDSGAVGELVSPDTGSLVPRNDISALTRVLRSWEGQSPDRVACRRRAESFSRERMIRQYVRLYRRVITTQ